MFAASGLRFRFANSSRRNECFVNLLVQFVAVCDDGESPVAFYLAKNLLGEEDHRKAFA